MNFEKNPSSNAEKAAEILEALQAELLEISIEIEGLKEGVSYLLNRLDDLKEELDKEAMARGQHTEAFVLIRAHIERVEQELRTEAIKLEAREQIYREIELKMYNISLDYQHARRPSVH